MAKIRLTTKILTSRHNISKAKSIFLQAVWQAVQEVPGITTAELMLALSETNKSLIQDLLKDEHDQSD